MKNGNPQVEDGHIQIANETAEALAKYRLSGQEYQVLWVIWRKTYGWHKKKDRISLGQIAKLTGMNRQEVARAIKKLVYKGVVKKDNSYVNIYQFNKYYRDWEQTVVKKDNSKGVLSKKTTPVIQKDNKTVINLDTHKRKERNSLQKKKTKHLLRTKKNIVQSSSIAFSFSSKKWENITNEDVALWSETYPACRIKIELLKMGDWLLSNPTKRKKNYRRFISNWLVRSQDKGGTKGVVYIPPEPKSENPEEKSKREKRKEEESEARYQEGLKNWRGMSLEKLRKEYANLIRWGKIAKVPPTQVEKDLEDIIKEKEKNG